MDRLSDLPDNVIEVILECLPVRDAVRTSILSKKWQYRWEIMSKLCLDYTFFDNMYRRGKPPSINYVDLVKRIMLQHLGPLLKFVLYIPNLGYNNWGDISLIIRCALRNGVRELSIRKAGDVPHILPSVFFSSSTDKLTKLKLNNCEFNPPPTFKGFPNLRILELRSISCPNLEILSNFISRSPELQIVSLNDLNNADQHLSVHAVKLRELQISGRFGSISLQGMQDLVYLLLYLEELSEGVEQAMLRKGSMLHMIGQLSNVQYLKLGGYIFDVFAAESLPIKLSGGLANLKKLVAFSIDLHHLKELHCLLSFVRSSPNLEELKIVALREADDAEEPCTISKTEVYAQCCLQRLRTVRICAVSGTEAELKLIEYLLGCSPVLEMMSIALEELDSDVKINVLKQVTRFCRASPKAELLC